MKKILTFIFVLLLCAKANAGEITLSWDSISEASGYKIVYGTGYDSLTQEIDVGVATEGPNNKRKYTVEGLTIGTVYFFKVKAYANVSSGGVGIESDLSNGAYGVAKIGIPSLTIN